MADTSLIGSDPLLTRPRLVVIHALLLLIIGGSLHAIISGDDHWPLCAYQMFSAVRATPDLTRLRLFGLVEEQGSVREIPLIGSRYLQPFDQSRLQRALSRLSARRDAPMVMPSVMRGCLSLYEANRVARRHSGPRLTGLRLYQLTWTLDPHAANRDQAEQRRLIVETMTDR